MRGLAWYCTAVGHRVFRRLGQPFVEKDGEHFYCVKFSRDGKYLAYEGRDEIITLWTVKDIAPELPVSAILQVQGDRLTGFSTPVSIIVFPQRQCSRIPLYAPDCSHYHCRSMLRSLLHSRVSMGRPRRGRTIHTRTSSG